MIKWFAAVVLSKLIKIIHYHMYSINMHKSKFDGLVLSHILFMFLMLDSNHVHPYAIVYAAIRSYGYIKLH